MLVEYYFPQSLSPSRLDRYLAGGWFRSGPSLFRAQVLCLDGEVHSVVNIRSQLDNYTFSKSLRKLYKKNKDRFRIEYGLATVDAAKERLYSFQKHRFKGFIFDTLEEFLFAGDSEFLFDTREIRVYDGNKLVAASFFDLGNRSMASLLGLYDPEYASYSLGIYTMILELNYALHSKLKFYYPGYVLEQFNGFDYKLRMGNIQYYNWQGRWRNLERLSHEKFILPTIKERILQLEAILSSRQLHYQKFLYPFFSVGYLNMVEEDFLKSVIYIQLGTETSPYQAERQLIIEYLPEENRYYLSWVRPNSDYVDFLNAEFSENFFNEKVFDKGLLVRDQMLFWDKSPQRIVEKATRFLWERPGSMIA